MLINKSKQIGLNFNPTYEQQIIKHRTSLVMGMSIPDEHKKEACERIEKTINGEGYKLYLPTQTVLDLSSKIKFDEDTFNFKFLDSIKEGKKVTFLMGNIFYRWYKSADKVNVTGISMVGNYLSYVFFSIDTKQGVLTLPSNNEPPFEKRETIHDLIRLIIFTELSPIETKELNPNQSTGTRRAGKYLNESDKKVIIVDSTWNLNIVVTKGFLVSGHFRVQPVGQGRQQCKLIWIKNYEKDGYVKGAKKLKQ